MKFSWLALAGDMLGENDCAELEGLLDDFFRARGIRAYARKAGSMSNVVFIYAVVTERDGYTLPWYVGQTVDVDIRRNDLVRECEQSETEQALWTRGEKAAGYKLAMKILEETVKGSADEREAYWIARMRGVNPELRNSTKGNAHTNRKEYLLKVQAQQRERIPADAAWLSQILKTHQQR